MEKYSTTSPTSVPSSRPESATSLDVSACKEAGIIVVGTTPSPPVSSTKPIGYATTQHTWALILALANKIPRDDHTVQIGGW